MLGKRGESVLDLGEQLIHEGQLVILLISDHGNKTRVVHLDQCLSVILHILLEEGCDQKSLRTAIEVVQQSVQFLTQSLLGTT